MEGLAEFEADLWSAADHLRANSIVNVIEPDHVKVRDQAGGSSGMFVPFSHFIEREGGDTNRKVTETLAELTTAHDACLTDERALLADPPSVVDEDFDFEPAMTEIHAELAVLIAESVEQGARIHKNREELGL